jgi:hypothetical protein
MKYFILLITFHSFSLTAQTDDAFFNALRNSDYNTLESFLQDNLDFCLFEDQQIMNKKAALTKLRSFIDANRPTGIELMHKGTSKDKSTNYKVARLNTSSGNYRVFIYSVGPLGPKSIKEVRIDRF